MYPAVPRIVPTAVAPMVKVGELLALHFDHTLGSDLDVGGLQVAVDNILFMGGLDAVDQLLDDGQRVVKSRGPLRSSPSTYSMTR
jgi:hypothetical protein